ncbi:hypothetical protein RJ640_029068 [Escallonia rubra]|uniref:RNase H type-1 domain-containing protein n=1 Tax=Escallonia rubra TaxID=112253 RepID=A0AA88S3N7_9ASTE|nr:hypothetical protein RJ640_029068 [Escallonia rubra]
MTRLALRVFGRIQGIGRIWLFPAGMSVRHHTPRIVFRTCDPSSEKLAFSPLEAARRIGLAAFLTDPLSHLESVQPFSWNTFLTGLSACYQSDLAARAEKDGLRAVTLSQTRSFKQFLNDCCFLDLGFKGTPFTWCNVRPGEANVRIRLDRALATAEWRLLFPQAQILLKCSFTPKKKSKEKSKGMAAIRITSELPFEAYSTSTGDIGLEAASYGHESPATLFSIIFEHVLLAFSTIRAPMSSEIQSVVASPATEEDDLLSRSTKKCKRRSSGDFFGCHDMSQENPPIARMMKKKGGMEEAKSDGSICGLREERAIDRYADAAKANEFDSSIKILQWFPFPTKTKTGPESTSRLGFRRNVRVQFSSSSILSGKADAISSKKEKKTKKPKVVEPKDPSGFDIAAPIWSSFAAALNMNISHLQSLDQRLDTWWTDSGKSQYDIVRNSSALFILWGIWKHRNAILFDNDKLNAHKRPKKEMGFHDRLCILSLNLPIMACKPPRIRWIKWHPPDAGYKLNTDSSALENTGGSIIRDSCAHYGLGTNLIAETKALLTGLELARSFAIPLSSIEVDSQNVIHSLESDKLSQTLRQANRVADSLASIAHQHKSQQLFLSSRELVQHSNEDKDTKVDWFVFMLRCLSFSVCSIRIERKVSPDLIYEIFSNMSFTSTRQDKEKCSKATSKVRSWKTRLEAIAGLNWTPRTSCGCRLLASSSSSSPKLGNKDNKPKTRESIALFHYPTQSNLDKDHDS